MSYCYTKPPTQATRLHYLVIISLVAGNLIFQQKSTPAHHTEHINFQWVRFHQIVQ